MGVLILLTGRAGPGGAGAGSGEAVLTADTELVLEVTMTGPTGPPGPPGKAGPPATPPLLEVMLPLLLPLFLAETLLSSDWLLKHRR